MTSNMRSVFKIACFATIAALMFSAQASADIIVLDDTFGDGVAGTNPGVGNGFTLAMPGSMGSATEAGGGISFSVNGGGNRATATSNDTFSLPNGFSLTFDYSIPAGGNPSETFLVGLANIDQLAANGSPNDTNGFDIDFLFAENTNTAVNGIAFSGRSRGTGPDLDIGLVTLDSGIPDGAFDTSQTVSATGGNVSLIVDAAGNYTFSVDGATPSTGNISALGLNTLTDLRVFVGAQGLATSAASPALLENITLEAAQAVPEPSSLALLGMGAVGLIARRRRS